MDDFIQEITDYWKEVLDDWTVWNKTDGVKNDFDELERQNFLVHKIVKDVGGDKNNAVCRKLIELCQTIREVMRIMKSKGLVIEDENLKTRTWEYTRHRGDYYKAVWSVGLMLEDWERLIAPLEGKDAEQHGGGNKEVATADAKQPQGDVGKYAQATKFKPKRFFRLRELHEFLTEDGLLIDREFEEFARMVDCADFSEMWSAKNSHGKVGYLVYKLKRLYSDEWFDVACKSVKTTRDRMRTTTAANKSFKRGVDRALRYD